MSEIIKVAAVQMDVTIGNLAANVDSMSNRIVQAVAEGASLVVFPECSLSGYCFDSAADAELATETTVGDHVLQLAALASESKVNVVFGFLEAAPDGIFNTAALATDQGRMHFYRKAHLPHLGIDRFTRPGCEPFDVVDLGSLRIGINICYDCSFPEPARVLALKGADLIVLPTNWPPGAGATADFIPNARALENNVYYMAVNRVGNERGFRFIGKSKICHPDGTNLAFADHDQEAVLTADIDPSVARNKHLVRVPGKHEIHRFNDRRPEMYNEIVTQQVKIN